MSKAFSLLNSASNDLIEGLFEEVRSDYLNSKNRTTPSSEKENLPSTSPLGSPAQELISDALLSRLSFAFQSPLEHALDLIDKEGVTRLVNRSCPSHCVFQVTGSFLTSECGWIGVVWKEL